MKRYGLSLILVLCLVVVMTPIVIALAKDGVAANQDWSITGGDLANNRYSTLSQINISNVNQLAGAWISPKFDDAASSRSIPAIKDGLIFVTAGSEVYALDAQTGGITWKFNADSRVARSEVASGKITALNQLEALSRTGRSVPNAQGVAVADGKVFVGMVDGQVAALDEKTGQLLWRVRAGDEAKPRDSVGVRAPTAPTYAEGEVFVGTNGDYDLPAVIDAFDADTGRQLWQFSVVPPPGEPGHETWPKNSNIWKHGGGGIWQTGAVDPELGLVYFGTGNAVPQYGGQVRPGNNLYTDCVVALDIKTGKLRWYYQIIHHDIWEADIALPVVLYDTQIDGRTVKAVAAMRPDGYLFLFDRETGKPLVPVEERPVTQSSFQKTAATQPFPLVPEGLLPECSSWKDVVPKGWKLDCEFYPWDFGSMVLAPGFSVRATPMSYSPQTGYFYAQGTGSIRPRRLVTDDPYFFALGGASDVGLLGLPPSRSFIAAIDGRTDRVVWKKEVPASELSRSFAGPVATAGGLLFHSTGSGILDAYDVKTGDVVWKFQTGQETGPIATYEINGEQYIAMDAGTSVWAFKLGGTIQQVQRTIVASRGRSDDAGAVDTDNIEVASPVFDHNNSGHRYATDEDTFNPTIARVKVGTRVIWVNNGRLEHTVVAEDGSWTTGLLDSADGRGVTFDKPGIYKYYCKEHPWAVGEVIVVSGNEEESTGGVYSREQAGRGRTAYDQNCSLCHQSDLSGTQEIPALKGDAFLAEWQGRRLVDLVDRTRTTMPQANPGSLSRDTYVDIVAYMLQMNGLPSGNQDLKTDSATLNNPIGK